MIWFLSSIQNRLLQPTHVHSLDLPPKPASYFLVAHSFPAHFSFIHIPSHVPLLFFYSACHAASCLYQYNNFTDVLIIHPYCPHDGCFNSASAKAAYESALDSAVQLSNERNLPLLATETCWGSLDDQQRAQSGAYELRQF